MTYRVIQWATGNIGSYAIKGILNHPELELVGVLVYSPDKAGQDAGDICGVGKTGIIATDNKETVLAIDADCVLYMPRQCDIEEVCRILESGKNIITTRSEFFNPRRSLDDKTYNRVAEACQKGSTTIHATGSSPGFITEAIPLTLASIARKLNSLTIDEYADLSQRPSPDLLFNIMGFGRKPETFESDSRRLEEAGVGFQQSILLLADRWGLAVERIEAKIDIAVVPQQTEIAAGILHAGTVGAQRMVWAGIVDGTPRISIRTNWYCSRNIEPSWDLRDTGWKVSMDSDSPLDVEFTFPVPMERMREVSPGLTANRPVNAIPAVCQAPPGLKTILDLPLITTRLQD